MVSGVVSGLEKRSGCGWVSNCDERTTKGRTRQWVDARLRRKRDGCGGFFVEVKRTRKKDWGRRR
uniref:Uncharacterized protein n=1 Tax=Cucumis melo TaxID=3656 RepID=A0A9I9CCD6_CUCME